MIHSATRFFEKIHQELWVRLEMWLKTLDSADELLTGLLAARLPGEAERRAELLLSLCHMLSFRLRTGNSLPLIGIIGSASCGKSTLFNSIADADIAAVTPIPHQTTGAIVLSPQGFAESAKDRCFLRPLVRKIDWAASNATQLVGAPETAVAVTPENSDRPFVLIDLPDIGTVESDEERQVTVRILPWLDRIILMLTEESFAQAEHEVIQDTLGLIHPDRARAELYVVLNRRHAGTTDAQFAARLEKARSLWPNASVSTLPHLPKDERFAVTDTHSLTAEAHARVGRMLAGALRNLAAETAADAEAIATGRRREARRLEIAVEDEISRAARFRNAFFSGEFRTRLDRFSPWRASLEKMRTLWAGNGKAFVENLIDVEPVEHHAEAALREVRALIARRVALLYDETTVSLPELPAGALLDEVAKLLAKTNERARHDIETLLTGLQEERKLKSPVWSATTGIAALFFLGDLVLPGVGSATSTALLGVLSAMGLSKSIHAEVMHRVRTSRVRDTFEDGLRDLLRRAAQPLLDAAEPGDGDLTTIAKRLDRWVRDLPED